MGWNSYDCYGWSVTEEEFKANVDYMNVHLKKYGWEYAVLDFCWYTSGRNFEPNPNQNETMHPVLHMDEYGHLARIRSGFLPVSALRGSSLCRNMSIARDRNLASMSCKRFPGRLSHKTRQLRNQECLSRYDVNEIDEISWLVRHMELRLFRLGRLQFEPISYKEAVALNVHISKDGPLIAAQCENSYQRALKFFLRDPVVYL